MDQDAIRKKNIRTRKRLLRGAGFWAGTIVILLFFTAPLIWLVSTSFKNYIDAFAMPPKNTKASGEQNVAKSAQASPSIWPVKS